MDPESNDSHPTQAEKQYSYTLQSGEQVFANSRREAIAACPFLSSMPVEKAEVFLSFSFLQEPQEKLETTTEQTTVTPPEAARKSFYDTLDGVPKKLERPTKKLTSPETAQIEEMMEQARQQINDVSSMPLSGPQKKEFSQVVARQKDIETEVSIKTPATPIKKIIQKVQTPAIPKQQERPIKTPDATVVLQRPNPTVESNIPIASFEETRRAEETPISTLPEHRPKAKEAEAATETIVEAEPVQIQDESRDVEVAPVDVAPEPLLPNIEVAVTEVESTNNEQDSLPSSEVTEPAEMAPVLIPAIEKMLRQAERIQANIEAQTEEFDAEAVQPTEEAALAVARLTRVIEVLKSDPEALTNLDERVVNDLITVMEYLGIEDPKQVLLSYEEKHSLAEFIEQLDEELPELNKLIDYQQYLLQALSKAQTLSDRRQAIAKMLRNMLFGLTPLADKPA